MPTSPPQPSRSRDVQPLNVDISYTDALAALAATEKAITDVCYRYAGNQGITHTWLFGMGVARRAIALISGFRAMAEQTNSLVALPIVRMQLDTVLRLYAGFFASDHNKFCEEVFRGAQIDRMKADDGNLMKDGYLLKRVAERNTWMVDVYRTTSGYIHFSSRHIHEVLRINSNGHGELVVGPTDHDREPEDFLEPLRCLHHLSIVLEFALEDWFLRMCRTDGVVLSAQEVWHQYVDPEPGE